MDAQRFLDGTIDRIHGVERTVGVLEHRLHVATEVKQFLALEPGDVLAFIGDRAGRRFEQFEHHIGHGGFAGAGFAHDGQRAAAFDGEGHIVDGLEHLLLARKLEFLGQVIDGDDRLARFELLLAHHVMLKQCVGVLAVLLGGDDALGCQRGGGCDQTLGVRVLRMLQYFQRRTGFDDLALVHDHDMLGALGGQSQIVGDEQHGGAERIGEHVQVVENLLLHGHVECGGRFVGDKQLRSAGQTDGDQRTLAHAAGELVRVLAGTSRGIGQTGFGQQTGDTIVHGRPGDMLLGDIPCGVVLHTGLDQIVGHTPTRLGTGDPLFLEIREGAFRGLAGDACLGDRGLGRIEQRRQFGGRDEGLVVVVLDIDLVTGKGLGQLGTLLVGDVHVVGGQCLLHLGADAPHRVEVAHRVLRHKTHLGAAQLIEILLLQTDELLPVKLDGAADHMAGAGQQSEHAHGRSGFAGTGFAYDGDPLPRVDGEGDIAYRMDCTVPVGGEVDGKILHLKQRTLLLLHGNELGFVVFHCFSSLLRAYGSSGQGHPSPHRPS